MELAPKPPWEQLSAERDHQYAWFIRYAELGDQRSVEKVSKLCGVPLKLVRDAASTFAWESRSAAFDKTVVSVVDSIQVDDTEALAMQFAVGRAMMRLGVEGIKLKNPALLKVKDLLTFLQEGAEMMRRGAGVADLTIEQRTTQDRVESTFRELLGD